MPCPPGAAMAEHLLAIASDPVSIRTILIAKDELDQDKQPLPFEAASAADSNHGELFSPLSDKPSPPTEGEDATDGESPVTVVKHTNEQGNDKEEDFKKRFAALSLNNEEETNGASLSSLQLTATAFELEKKTGTAMSTPLAGSSPQRSHAIRRPGFSRQLAVMTWRTGVDILRNPTLLRLHLGIALLMGLATGAVFWQLDSSNVGVQNRMGGTFFALAFLAFTSITTVDLLILERAVVIREVRGGYYRPSAYLLSKLTLDGVFLRALPALLYWCCFYYMAGFRSGAAYGATYAFCLLTFSCAIGALSMAITVISNTAGEASFGMNFIILFSIMFTGFLVNVNSIPAWLRWIHYLSIFFYAFEAMITNEMTGRTFSFQASGYGELTGIVGNTYLETLGFDPGATTRDIGVLVGLYGAFVLLCLLLMQLRVPSGRAPVVQQLVHRTKSMFQPTQ